MRSKRNLFQKNAWGRLGYAIVILGLLFVQACTSGESDEEEISTDPKVTKLQVKEGFRAEHLYTPIDSTEGSWVAMAFDDKGRLITSDQYGSLFRLEIPPIGSPDSIPPKVEKLGVNMGHAQGLLWAFNSLYVMVNNYTSDDSGEDEGFNRQSGLYRLFDSTGDDQLDSVVYLKPMVGWGEHGPHSIKLSPDGNSLFVIAGNHTDVVEMDHYRYPKNWEEDNLYPLILDPRGHANDRKAPGGWIAELDPEGKEWTLHAAGFRNAFDFDFNENGDLFVYDADMEWDLGMPWYRPTRISHVPSGSESGWRTGNSKWSSAWPDNLPALVDLGQGSPTNVVIGTHGRFPDQYKKALFAFDWSFGIIYAVHLTPDGATYSGKAEEFLSGLPLPLTDGVIGPDGAMYFMTGGRRLDSDLYRVYHKNYEKYDTHPLGDLKQTEENKLRRQLEEYHKNVGEEAVSAAWENLDHSDRFIRFAARIALEHQPVDLWAEKVLTATEPVTLMQGAMALARQNKKEYRDGLLNSLNEVDLSKLSDSEKVDFTRTVELILLRLGKPAGAAKENLIGQLSEQYPAGNKEIDRQLSKILVYLDAPEMIEPTLALIDEAKNDPSEDYATASDLVLRNPEYGLTIGQMLKDMPPAQQTYYAIALSEKKGGWTPELRERYFSWFYDAFKYKGGFSYVGFVNHARKTALDNVPKDQFDFYNEMSGDTLISSSGLDILTDRPSAEGPGRNWKLEAAVDTVENSAGQRDFANGKKMFQAASCSTCHMIGREGNDIGPDLTQVGTRYGTKDILEKIINPNNAISDQYAAKVYDLKDGNSVVGRLQREDDKNYYVVQNPYSPDEIREVPKSQVRRVSLSTVSMMPPRLINSLNPEELRDLMAYLKAGGNENNSIYKNENSENDVIQ